MALQSTNPTAVIVILNYNGLRFLGSRLFDSLDSVLKIRYQPLKVVFVDNGSSDGSPDVIKEKYGDVVEVLQLGKNFGYALGNDIGALKVGRYKPKYVIFMNNDFIVTNEDCVNELIKHMEEDARTVCTSGIFMQANRKRVDNAGFL